MFPPVSCSIDARTPSDVEVGDFAGVVLDELAARLTASPISIEKTWSTALASSIVTSCSVRCSGSIVVSKSWSAFISPRPLKRCSGTPSRATSSTRVRSSSNEAPARRAHRARRRRAACRRAPRAPCGPSRSPRTRASSNMARGAAGSVARSRSASRSTRATSSCSPSDHQLGRRTARPRDPRPSGSAITLLRVGRRLRRGSADSSRKVIVSWPYSARSAAAQPSYCLSSRPVFLPPGVREARSARPGGRATSIFSSLSRSRTPSSSDSFSM